MMLKFLISLFPALEVYKYSYHCELLLKPVSTNGLQNQSLENDEFQYCIVKYLLTSSLHLITSSHNLISSYPHHFTSSLHINTMSTLYLYDIIMIST